MVHRFHDRSRRRPDRLANVRRRGGSTLFASFLALLIGAAPAAGAADWNVRLAFNNDLLVNNTVEDDFYTFGGRLEVTYAGVTYRWHENAFTDRVDGFRFDETYLTIGAPLCPRRLAGWCFWLGGGVAHVGEGLLGQEAQNEVHELIGDQPVLLDYLDGVDDYHVHVQAEIGRQWHLAKKWTWGPQLGIHATPGFRWNAVGGLRTIWRPSERFAIDVMVGARLSDSELALLEPHIESESPAAQVVIDLPLGFVAEWSLNRYGTDREHVSFGYVFGGGRSKRRHGTWIETGATR